MAANHKLEHVPEKPVPEWPEQKVSCELCMREIPRSEALVSEAQDYALYFCGIECFDEWRRQLETK